MSAKRIFVMRGAEAVRPARACSIRKPPGVGTASHIMHYEKPERASGAAFGGSRNGLDFFDQRTSFRQMHAVDGKLDSEEIRAYRAFATSV